MKELRIFFANAKGDDANQIESLMALATRLLVKGTGRDVKMTSGLRDFEANFARTGSWEAWQRDVAQGIDYLSREPRYNGAVVPGRRVGKATAAILQGFLYTGKPVLLLEADALVVVRECVKVEERNWTTGWEVR